MLSPDYLKSQHIVEIDLSLTSNGSCSSVPATTRVAHEETLTSSTPYTNPCLQPFQVPAPDSCRVCVRACLVRRARGAVLCWRSTPAVTARRGDPARAAQWTQRLPHLVPSRRARVSRQFSPQRAIVAIAERERRWINSFSHSFADRARYRTASLNDRT